MKNRRLTISLVTILVLTVVNYAQEAVPATSPVGPQPAIKTFELDSKLMARQMPYSVILPATYDVKTCTIPGDLHAAQGLAEIIK